MVDRGVLSPTTKWLLRLRLEILYYVAQTGGFACGTAFDCCWWPTVHGIGWVCRTCPRVEAAWACRNGKRGKSKMSNDVSPLLIPLLLIGFNRSWFIYIRFIRGHKLYYCTGWVPSCSRNKYTRPSAWTRMYRQGCGASFLLASLRVRQLVGYYCLFIPSTTTQSSRASLCGGHRLERNSIRWIRRGGEGWKLWCCWLAEKAHRVDLLLCYWTATAKPV